MFRFILLALMLLVPFASVRSALGAESSIFLRFSLEIDGARLPFVVELSPGQRGELTATIINGTESIDCGALRIEGDTWVIDLPYYGSRIRGVNAEGGGLTVSLNGTSVTFDRCTWVKERGDGPVEIPGRIRLVNHAHDRFDLGMMTQVPVDISGRWSVRFSSAPDVPAVGEFDVLDDGRVLGTFLTTTGDYRFLEGRMNGSVLELSCFDGAHAFHFRANADGRDQMTGDFWSGSWWHETWTATRDDDAVLPDGFGRIAIVGPGDMSDLRMLSLDDKLTRLGDHLGSKMTVVELFGSWCPNCADASAFLHEMKDRYGDDGLAIIGLAFELNEDPWEAKKRVVHHMRHFAGGDELPWLVLLGGKPDKTAAAESIPSINKVESFPTFIFLDERGRIFTIYSGFMGPATGERHDEMREALEGVIKRGLSDR